MAKEELFFVGIENPVQLRREILLSTKNAVQFLKKNEELKDLRIEKIELIMQYKNQIKEINALINKLKETLPKAKLRVGKAKSIRHKKKLKYKKSVKHKPKKVSELEKLESELGDIEKKLGRLR